MNFDLRPFLCEIYLARVFCQIIFLLKKFLVKRLLGKVLIDLLVFRHSKTYMVTNAGSQ